nr:MAG TPA: hypothetical protein [Caudoviricetes sp.]
MYIILSYGNQYMVCKSLILLLYIVSSSVFYA